MPSEDNNKCSAAKFKMKIEKNTKELMNALKIAPITIYFPHKRILNAQIY